MKFVKSFSLAFVSAVAMFFASAVVLGIANIYFAGHGVDWLSDEITNGMSALSYLMCFFTTGTFAGVFGFSWWVQGKNQKKNKETNNE